MTKAPSEGRRPLGRRVVHRVLVGFFVVGIAVEGSIALFIHFPGLLPGSGWFTEGVRSAYLREDWNVIQADPELVRWDSEVTYLLRPGPAPFTNREFATTLQANQAGLRDDDVSLQEPQLLVLGDSYALGWGVDVEESFPQRLERQLQRRVLNASMASFGTARQTILLERLDTSKVQAVVVQYFLNDYVENRTFLEGGNELAITPRGDFEALIAIDNRYRPLDYLRAFFDRSSFDRAVAEANPSEVARACLEILDESEALEGLPILLLQIDPWADPQFNLEQEWTTLLDNGHFPDLEGRLQLFSVRDILESEDFFDLDPHLRPAGHEKLAGALAPRLVSMLR